MDNRGNSRANTCAKPNFLDGQYLLDISQLPSGIVVNHSNLADRTAFARDKPFKFLPHHALDGSVLDYHGFYG